MIETSISLPKILLDEAATLAQHLNLSPSQLIEMALAHYLKIYPPDAPNEPTARLINQGDVYWVQLPDPSGLAPGIPHPHVILQDDIFNHSRIPTVVACLLTTNAKRINLPGNILLEAGEANLLKASIVEVSKVSTLAKAELGDYIGSLTAPRLEQIFAGMRFLQTSFFTR